MKYVNDHKYSFEYLVLSCLQPQNMMVKDVASGTFGEMFAIMRLSQ